MDYMGKAMIFDTHAHYDDDWFDEDRDELLRGLSANAIDTVVNVGASMEGSRASVELSVKYPFVYAAVGVHPDYAQQMTEADIKELKELSRHDKVVAIGEIGLDYGHEEDLTEAEREAKRSAQKYWFKRQLALACEVSLPVIIHSRGADGDTLSVMREWAEEVSKKPGFRGGIIHCFSGSPEIAEEYRKLGFHIGVGGVLTFKNARRLPDVVAAVPLSQIVLETDCPYLAPVPHRGERNDSSLLRYVVAKIAEIKGISEEEVIRVTAGNARQLFGISGEKQE